MPTAALARGPCPLGRAAGRGGALHATLHSASGHPKLPCVTRSCGAKSPPHPPTFSRSQGAVPVLSRHRTVETYAEGAAAPAPAQVSRSHPAGAAPSNGRPPGRPSRAAVAHIRRAEVAARRARQLLAGRRQRPPASPSAAAGRRSCTCAAARRFSRATPAPPPTSRHGGRDAL